MRRSRAHWLLLLVLVLAGVAAGVWLLSGRSSSKQTTASLPAQGLAGHVSLFICSQRCQAIDYRGLKVAVTFPAGYVKLLQTGPTNQFYLATGPGVYYLSAYSPDRSEHSRPRRVVVGSGLSQVELTLRVRKTLSPGAISGSGSTTPTSTQR